MSSTTQRLRRRIAWIGGGVLTSLGVLWMCVPTLFADSGPALHSLDVVERQINGSMVASAGLLLAIHRTWRPWWMASAGLVFWCALGALLART